MSSPAAKLKPFAGGPHTMQDPPPAAGHITTAQLLLSGDQRLLVPVIEVGTAGALPVRPTLVESLTAGRPIREVRCASGELVRSPTTTKQRVQFGVEWEHLTRDEADELDAFFGPAGTDGTRLSFTLEPDGEGNGELQVRLLETPTFEWVDTGVYRVPMVRVEEVF